MDFSGTAQVPTNADIDYVAAKGFPIIRLPFKWERVQPVLNGPLDPTHLGYLKSIVVYAATKGIIVRLDCHNFGQYGFDKIGGGVVTGAHLAEFWRLMAIEFISDTNVEFNIMNEPAAMPSVSAWPDAAQLTINAIGSVDTTKPIIVDGDGFSTAYTWPTVNPTLHLLTSLGNRLKFSPHVYPDSDGSGRYTDWDEEVAIGDLLDPIQPAVLDTDILIKRLTPPVEWAIKWGKELDVGELGVPNTFPLEILQKAVSFLQANNVSFTAWAAGHAWGTGYLYSIAPDKWITGYPGVAPTADAVQMAVLTQFTGAAQPTVYFLTGPATGAVSTPSSNFALEYRGVLAADRLFTFSDNGAGGSFTPPTATLEAGVYNPTAAFTYTPPAGAMTTRIDVTNDGALTNPPGVIFSTEVDLFAGIAVPQNIISDVQWYAAYIGPCRRMYCPTSTPTIKDFEFAGQALGVANLGRVLDFAAIAAWDPTGTAKTIIRYSQEPLGHHQGPVANTDAPPSTTADYPVFLIDTDGHPADNISNSRMDMVSPLHGATGRTVIANFNYASGIDVLNWDFLSRIQFGPSAHQYSDGTVPDGNGGFNPVNEQGTMSLGVIANEYHIYAETWEANKVDGWRTRRDGVEIARNRTYASALTADFNRPHAHLGYHVFIGITCAIKSRDWIIWNSAVPDANAIAIENAFVAHYGTVLPTTITPKVVMDFAADIYTVNGVASTLNALTSGTRSRNSTGLLADGTTSLAGAALAMFAGADYTIIVEQGECATAIPANNSAVLLCAKGAKTFNMYVDPAGMVFVAGTGGGATGSAQAYNLDNKDLRLTQKYGLSRTSGLWRTAINGAGNSSTAASLETGWTSVILGNSFFGGRIHKITITDSPSFALQLLTETDVGGTVGTLLPNWYMGPNESGPEGGGGVVWPSVLDFQYFRGRGCTIARLPFRWAQIQPTLNGALDTAHLTNFANYITDQVINGGGVLILDCHSYGAHETYGSIGGGTVTGAHLADMFGKLGTWLVAQGYSAPVLKRVWFDLMNEPGGPLTPATWYTPVCVPSMTALRSAGVTGTILVPSYGNFSNALQFMRDGNYEALVAAAISDPDWAVTVHRYLDSTGAGNSNTYAGRYTGMSGMRPVTRACRDNGWRYFLGETGAAKAPSVPLMCTEFRDQLAYMYANRDVALGCTVWGAGAIADADTHSLSPYNIAVLGPGAYGTTPYGERPQVGIMREFL